MAGTGFGMARDMILARKTPIKTVRRDLEGTTIVITGGTDGMGNVAAMRLVEMKASLYLLGRNPKKTSGTVDALNRRAGEERAVAVSCDLASLSSVRDCAASLLEACPRIDLLINCAGLNTQERRMSPDGYEQNWAVNYFSPFVLSDLLLERIQASAPARIVYLTSATARTGGIKFDDLQLEQGWTTLRSYGQAKLAINALTVSLARRIEGTGVTVNALNPGFIRTALLRDFKGAMRVWQYVMRWMASPPEVGAERILRVALSPEYEGLSGRIFDEDKLLPPGGDLPDEETIERLWKLSVEAAGA